MKTFFNLAIASLTSLFSYFTVTAQDSLKTLTQPVVEGKESGLFIPTYYGKPFLTDMHHYDDGTIDIGMVPNRLAYSIMNENETPINPYKELSASPKVLLELKLGSMAPIYSKWIKNQKKWGWSFYIPASMVTTLSFSEGFTFPIVNFDYNFGFSFNTIKNVNKGFLKNFLIDFRPFMHECTHVGGEYVDYFNKTESPIARMHSSYEYSEIGIVINDIANRQENNHSFKLGTMVLFPTNWDIGHGFWNTAGNLAPGIKGTEVDGQDSPPVYASSANNTLYGRLPDIKIIDSRAKWSLFEPYFQYEMRLFDSPVSSNRIPLVFSADLRFRPLNSYVERTNFLYKYQENGSLLPRPACANYESEHYYQHLDLPHQRYVPSINMQLGWSYYPSPLSNYRVAFMIHGYYGQFPYGQFRNLYNYWFLGTGFTLTRR